MDDAEMASLLARLRQGDERARQQIISYIAERLRPLVHKLLRMKFPRVALHAETGDILNETICRLIPYIENKQFEPCSDVEGFYRLAARVARNTLIDTSRKHFGSLQGHPITEGMEANHPKLQMSSGFKAWRENLRVHELVERLPDRERTVIEMRLYLNLRTSEIAQALGVHAGTISHRLASAKEMLGQMLREDEARAE